MALSLHKTSKHGRSYKGTLPNGDTAGYSKTSIAPMHYETVPGSGDYDCPIDLKCDRITTAEVDGYEMINAGWHFRLQTEPATGIQKPQGTVGFGGKQGEHWFYFRLANCGYIHWPTRDIAPVGGAPDYSEAPTLTEKNRNLGTHPEVADEVVVANTLIRWGNIWNTPGGGELYLKWGLKGGKMKEEVVINQAAREFIAANNPPLTPADETYFGFRFEIDMADVPKLWRNGEVKDMDTDDFDDDDGNGLHLTNALDDLLAFMPLDEVYVGRKGGRRPLRKRFYKSGGQNYLMVAAKVSDIAALLPGDLKFDPSMTQEQVAQSADDGNQFDLRSYGHPNYPKGLLHKPFDNTYASLNIGAWDWSYPGTIYNQGSFYQSGVRFTPDVPHNASFVGTGPQYATITLYRDDGFASSALGFDMNLYSDVKGPNQPAFANDHVDSTGPAENWVDSASVGRASHDGSDPGAGNAFPAMDVAAPFTEVVEQVGWVANNGVRFAIRPSHQIHDPNNTGAVGKYLYAETYNDVAAKAAVLDAFYVVSSDRRKPGEMDDNGARNQRTSRLQKSKRSYRLNNDSPTNNKNRNRFTDMPVDS